MQIQTHSNFSFQSHVPNKKFVLLGGFSPVSKNGNQVVQEIPDVSSFMAKPNPSVLYSAISFYNQVKLKMFPNSQKRLQNLNKLV